MRALLAEPVGVDTHHADGATALAWAVHWDDRAMTELLIQAGADVSTANDLAMTPLMLACTNGSAPMVDLLLRSGADPNATRASGETALMMAARSGSVSVTRLNRGADVNATTTGGHTALMWAAAEQHVDVVTVLAEIGADVHARTAVETRPPRPRVRRPRCSADLTVNPADIPREGDADPPRPQGGFSPLLHAVLAGGLDVVRVLVAAGADVDETAPDGVTALMLSLTKRHEQIALYLIDRGADPNPADAGYTALHLASATGQLDAARALLAHGATPNVRMEMPQRLTTAFEIGVFSSPGSGRLLQKGSTPFGGRQVRRRQHDAGACGRRSRPAAHNERWDDSLDAGGRTR